MAAKKKIQLRVGDKVKLEFLEHETVVNATVLAARQEVLGFGYTFQLPRKQRRWVYEQALTHVRDNYYTVL